MAFSEKCSIFRKSKNNGYKEDILDKSILDKSRLSYNSFGLFYCDKLTSFIHHDLIEAENAYRLFH